MSSKPTNDPVLSSFRQKLDKLYGKRIERVILYGSRARGDAHPDSDYDVAVFLYDMTPAQRWDELDKLAHLTTGIIRETGELVHAMAYQAGAYQERTPLMHEIRGEGIDL